MLKILKTTKNNITPLNIRDEAMHILLFFKSCIQQDKVATPLKHPVGLIPTISSLSIPEI